jgi:hypothetical protein
MSKMRLKGSKKTSLLEIAFAVLIIFFVLSLASSILKQQALSQMTTIQMCFDLDKAIEQNYSYILGRKNMTRNLVVNVDVPGKIVNMRSIYRLSKSGQACDYYIDLQVCNKEGYCINKTNFQIQRLDGTYYTQCQKDCNSMKLLNDCKNRYLLPIVPDCTNYCYYDYFILESAISSLPPSTQYTIKITNVKKYDYASKLYFNESVVTDGYDTVDFAYIIVYDKNQPPSTTTTIPQPPRPDIFTTLQRLWESLLSWIRNLFK